MMAPAPIELPRCPPASDMAEVLNEQFAYLQAMNEAHLASEAEALRWLRVSKILLEPFEELSAFSFQLSAKDARGVADR